MTPLIILAIGFGVAVVVVLSGILRGESSDSVAFARRKAHVKD